MAHGRRAVWTGRFSADFDLAYEVNIIQANLPKIFARCARRQIINQIFKILARAKPCASRKIMGKAGSEGSASARPARMTPRGQCTAPGARPRSGFTRTTWVRRLLVVSSVLCPPQMGRWGRRGGSKVGNHGFLRRNREN